METGYFRFKVGELECASLYDGSMDYSLESMVTNAPLTTIQAALRAQGLPEHAITTPYAYLLVDTGQHKILADMGAGKLAPTTGRLLDSLGAAGLAPEAIDSVFITHAHPDHVGGALDEAGKPVFRRASYFISKTEWDFWFSEEAISKAGERFTQIARQKLAPLKDKTNLLETEAEVLPCVSVLFAPGHTPGHMVVSIESRGERLMYTADTVLHPLHLEHPDWLPVFDILPDAARASKQRIFDLAAATGCLVLGQHFPPFPNLGHVVKQETGWKWQPVGKDG